MELDEEQLKIIEATCYAAVMVALSPKIVAMPPKPEAMEAARDFALALAKCLVRDVEGILK
jgi:hypothetical protein